MARGINKVILIGNVGQDPEVKYMPSGGAVTNLSVATSESWKDKNTGQMQERTEWHRVTLYNRLGEIAGQYLKKGSKVYLEGSLRTRKWQGQDGQDRYTTEIIANELQMLDTRPGGQEPSYSNAEPYGNYGGGQPQDTYSQNQGGYGGNPQYAPQPGFNPQQRPAAPPRPAPQNTPKPAPMDNFDDEIPF